MDSGAIVAIITGAFTLIGVIITVTASNKNTIETMKEQMKLILYRIEQLEKKQDKHNTLIERMYEAEDDIHVLKEKMSVANHRIDDLEHKGE